MDEIDVETITNQAENFSWLKGKVDVEVVPSSKESSKRLLIDKILSKKNPSLRLWLKKFWLKLGTL